jgi:glyoxylase-like metal-dependent hydrolase (beta-lactamase superfamily II)
MHVMCCLAGGILALSGQENLVMAQQAPAGAPLEVVRVQPDFYMIAGAGANIGVQVGADGAIVVDAGTAEKADAVIAAIAELSKKPIRYIIDTSGDPDHVGGNQKLAAAGRSFAAPAGGAAAGGTLAAQGTLTLQVIGTAGGAPIVATNRVLERMSESSGKGAVYPTEAWPSEVVERTKKVMYLNHEGIEIVRHPAAHTDGDSTVFFRASDVIVAGDILDTTRYPVIDIKKGGTIQGEIDALNWLIDEAIPPVPLPFQEGGTQIVPGHGRICEQADVVEYRDMVTIIRDVVQDMIGKGMSLDQIQAANPTLGYDERYGATSGAWTTELFVEAIYRSLTAKK